MNCLGKGIELQPKVHFRLTKDSGFENHLCKLVFPDNLSYVKTFSSTAVSTRIVV